MEGKDFKIVTTVGDISLKISSLIKSHVFKIEYVKEKIQLVITVEKMTPLIPYLSTNTIENIKFNKASMNRI